MTVELNATYRCTVCGVLWSYEAVRHLACCRDCGGGLLRTSPERDAHSGASEAAAVVRHRATGRFG